VIDMELIAIEAGEKLQVAKVLSIAMLSNPIHIAVLRGQGEVERQYLGTMFLRMLKDRPGDVFVTKHDGTIVGVLRSYKCHGSQRSQAQARQKLKVDERDLGDVDARMKHWSNSWDERHPWAEHRHLGPIGVLPQFQRQGLGSKMMERFCAEVDSKNEAAFLETDRLTNVRFYEKYRFRTVDESLIFGVKNFFMWRPTQN
jgi:ribosomal protein S18 acetylase RimI-like enzyme